MIRSRIASKRRCIANDSSRVAPETLQFSPRQRPPLGPTDFVLLSNVKEMLMPRFRVSKPPRGLYNVVLCIEAL